MISISVSISEYLKSLLYTNTPVLSGHHWVIDSGHHWVIDSNDQIINFTSKENFSFDVITLEDLI